MTVTTTPESGVETQVLVSIVVPALNEELTIGEFVDWCRDGLELAGVPGEILIIDSSTDRTAEIARAHGATVVSVPKRGLGRAYIDALPHIRGRFIIMGDCDLTYDFREIAPFIEKLQEGNQFVMGTRMKGYIEAGAMPPHHRYFGTPLTTWLLNCIYGTHYSDIHCGMRALTREALDRIDLQSQGWEYASEMVLKAAKLKLPTAEVPIRFYKDPPGRLSHHRRVGWVSSWIAGWVNLRAMFLYAPDFFLFRPGVAALVIGLLLAVIPLAGPVALGPVTLNLHWMLLGVTLATTGYAAVQSALLARAFYNFDPAYTARLAQRFSYNRGTGAGILLGAVGIVLNLIFLVEWIHRGLKLLDFSPLSLFGLLLIIIGFQTFTFTLLLHMILNRWHYRGGDGA